MSQLRHRITASPRHDQLVRECAQMIEHFIAGAGGVKGFTLRSAMHAAQRARPELLDNAARRLLPEFLDALQPLFSRWENGSKSDFTAFLQQHEDEATDAVLAVADERASASNNRMLTSIYGRMRGGAGKDARRVLPELGRLIDREITRQEQESV